MNKKGFTLVELLAAIAIIAILAVFATPAVNDMRIELLTRTYESRINMIKNAAINWADDFLENVPVDSNATCFNTNTCASCTNIGYLIENEYLSGSDDNRTVMKNPLTNESLNNKKVCVKYNSNDISTRKLTAYIVE